MLRALYNPLFSSNHAKTYRISIFFCLKILEKPKTLFKFLYHCRIMMPFGITIELNLNSVRTYIASIRSETKKLTKTMRFPQFFQTLEIFAIFNKNLKFLQFFFSINSSGWKVKIFNKAGRIIAIFLCFEVYFKNFPIFSIKTRSFYQKLLTLTYYVPIN